MARNFAFGEAYEAFIDREVESGRYANAEEVVREGLRLLNDTPPLEGVAELRRLVLEARTDDSLVEADAIFDRLEARYGRASVERRK